jgi:hypothetical protein
VAIGPNEIRVLLKRHREVYIAILDRNDSDH